jgi:ComF family protein
MCPVCAADENELDWMRSACVYDDVSKSVMLPFKHAHQLKYWDMMTRAMINSLRELKTPVDLVMPVPLASLRLFKRGYNQAALLARPIAKHFGIKIDFNSVKRKFRGSMGHMTYRQRHENIKGVFRVARPENIRGKVVLLVDDVMTTGATFSEMNKVLKKAGAKAVYGVTFCRVVRAI